MLGAKLRGNSRYPSLELTLNLPLPLQAAGRRDPGSAAGSGLRIEEAPGHGTDLIEEVEGDLDSVVIDSTSAGEETEVGIDLLGRGVGNAPVVKPISTCSAVSLAEICGNRAGGSDDLLGEALQRSWDSADQGQGNACGLEGG